MAIFRTFDTATNLKLISDSEKYNMFLQFTNDKLVLSKDPKNLILGTKGDDKEASNLGVKLKFTTKFLEIN